MGKKLLVLFLLFIFFIVINLKFLLLTITGLVSSISTIGVNIAGIVTLGKFIYFSYPLQVNLGCADDQNVTFTVVFENMGNVNIDERIEIYVKNSTRDTIASYYDDYYNLAPLEFRSFSVNWTSTKGTYLVIANDSYNSTFENKTEEEIHSFFVTSNAGIGTLRRFPAQIVDTIPPGRTKIYPAGIQLWLQDACNSTNVTLNKTQGIPGDWVSLSQDNLYLTPDVVNSTDINITIPPLTPEGVYDNGTISAYADGQRVDIGLNITVLMNDIKLEIQGAKVQAKVCKGENVNLNLSITKTLPPEDIYVNITYQILDSNHTVYDENKDYNLLLSNTTIQKSYTLTVPSSAKEGFYMFLVTLDYNSSLTQTYANFEVISCPTKTSISTGAGGGGGPMGPSAEIQNLTAHKLSLNLSDEILTVITGNKTSFTASVKNIGTELAKSVRISIEGLPSEWIDVFPTTVDIHVGELEEFLIAVNIPNETKTGVYKLKVMATNDVESNTVILTLIVGRDPKEVAELLLNELESVRAEAKRSLLIEDCINTTSINTSYQDAELAFEKGMTEYENKNYEGAINWFEYALPVENKVVDRVNIVLELEVETINQAKSVSVIPSFFKPAEQLQLAGTYLQEKNYEKICDPILEIKRLIFIGLIFWFIIVILVILIIIIVILIKRKRKKEVYKEPGLMIPPTS